MARGDDTVSEVDWRHYEPLDLTPILAGALDAFYEHGFHGTTVRDIARRVGLTVPALYYHHENKEGVFTALLELGTGDVAWRVRAAAAAGGERPQEQFVNVVEAIVLHTTQRPQLSTLDLELRHLSTRNRRRYAARRKEIEDLLLGIVQAGVRHGVFTATVPEETARAVLGMCQSIARWYRPDGPLSPADVAHRYIDIALLTVGARPGPDGRGASTAAQPPAR
ncbi:AcrR family transcriptional regulator [Saccharomonospora amisosensis]|uniref:AcrR family transcriptional regulator n=1 Tax=Saccharomonospora amisosensis TaxID=1128677 RepID=A0A7X5UQT5_9PSEU|nr:TetR/AcrR family transcriptional regulator [Saccharomonospora amisosensis]NIJ12485.1 AcrR family transcriptional regulator [Saccharomonospora amisosensis]